MRRRTVLSGLLLIAAASRILLQVAALPPYAGLDEIYHVARLVFERSEGRAPTMDEASVPPYVASIVANDPKYPADIAELGNRWPEVARSRDVLLDRPVTAAELRPYIRPNYEAQQAALYYVVAARVVPATTMLGELRAWRLLAAVLALGVVLATACIATRFFGEVGFVAAALVVSLPTWVTLTVRASNDAFACALLAIGLAMSVAAPTRWSGIAAEGLAWAGAIASKLYAWPVFAATMVLWWQQRAPRRRVVVVTALCGVAALGTLAELSSRTRNPVGAVAFDPPRQQGAAVVPIDYLNMVKTTIASGIWTSGQHWNALTTPGMALYALPVLAAMVVAARRHRRLLLPVGAALGAFALAQVVNGIGFIRLAKAAGASIPGGGQEGWYWYSTVPLVAGIVLAATVVRFRWIALWLVAWDVVIHECALFHDFVGNTSPATRSFLFRWGPLQAPFTANLEAVGVGPLSGSAVALRVVHLVAFIVLFVLVTKGERGRRGVPYGRT